MKKIIQFIFIAGAFIMLSGCGASRVNTDYDEHANFGNYHSFRFTDSEIQTGTNPVYHSSLIDNTVHAQIAMELDARGIHEDDSHPDMLIAYHTYTERKRQSINNYYPMMYGGYGWGFYPWGMAAYPYGYWNGYNRTYVYTEGTLIIDAIDAKSNQLVWRGSVSDAINSPNDLHHKAVKAVQVIFKKFPIQSGKSSFQHDAKPIARKN